MDRPAKTWPHCWAAIPSNKAPAENDALRVPGKDPLLGVAHVALLAKRQAKVGRHPAPRRAYAYEPRDQPVRLAESLRFEIMIVSATIRVLESR